MFGIAAVVVFTLNFVLVGLAAHTNTWFSPLALISLGLACLAVHLLGVGTGWVVRRQS